MYHISLTLTINTQLICLHKRTLSLPTFTYLVIASEPISDFADDRLELYRSLVIKEDLRDMEGDVPVTFISGNCRASTVRLDVEATLSFGMSVTRELSKNVSCMRYCNYYVPFQRTGVVLCQFKWMLTVPMMSMVLLIMSKSAAVWKYKLYAICSQRCQWVNWMLCGNESQCQITESACWDTVKWIWKYHLRCHWLSPPTNEYQLRMSSLLTPPNQSQQIGYAIWYCEVNHFLQCRFILSFND